MAILRQVEERDAKGNTLRMNPAITFKQDKQIRKIIGRHDWSLTDNPDYHEPVTAQVQNGKILFFTGLPDTSQTRALAKEISIDKVPAYIVEELTKHPMRVREARPTVYEVRIATIGDVEVTQMSELTSDDGQSVIVTPVAPNLTPSPARMGAPRPRMSEEASA